MTHTHARWHANEITTQRPPARARRTGLDVDRRGDTWGSAAPVAWALFVFGTMLLLCVVVWLARAGVLDAALAVVGVE